MKNQKKGILVVGGGLIGCGWAATFSAAGHDTVVLDTDPAVGQSLATIYEVALNVIKQLNLVHTEASPPTHIMSLNELPFTPDFVQESLPEQLVLKKRVFAELEPVLPLDVVIASSSSGISPSELQADMRYPERLVIGHPCNPPYLMPVVELCGGKNTGVTALANAKAVYESLGKTVLVMKREAPGHLVNRLQAALWREAVHLVNENIASMEDVERAVTEGLAARWTVMGPSMIFHLAGGDAGIGKFLEDLGDDVETWWDSLGTPRLDGATRANLISGMADFTKGQAINDLTHRRDQIVPAVMKTIKEEKEVHQSTELLGENKS